MTISHPGWKAVRRSLVSLLMTGWVANAAAISVAHLLQADTHPALVRVLLALSFNLPFGLLLNEMLAPREALHGPDGLMPCRVELLVFQFVCSLLAIGSLTPGASWDSAEPFVLALCLAGASWASYMAVLLIYRQVAAGHAGPGFLFAAGATPGLLTMLSYCAYFVLYRNDSRMAADWALYAICILPALGQFLILRCLARDPACPAQPVPGRVDTTRFMMLLVLVAVMCLAGLLGRRSIAVVAADMAAVCLVLINGVLSVMASITKADYLSGQGRELSSRITASLIGVVVILAAATLLRVGDKVWVALACVAIAQYVLLRLLVNARERLFISDPPVRAREAGRLFDASSGTTSTTR